MPAGSSSASAGMLAREQAPVAMTTDVRITFDLQFHLTCRISLSLHFAYFTIGQAKCNLYT